jgi:NAD(P)-dependent dehydrogenase (short-subunit alcohol dehydrogenase family)
MERCYRSGRHVMEAAHDREVFEHRVLEGKVAFVTGASPNIGGVLASGLAAAGAAVVCNDVVAEAAADRVARIEAVGGIAMAAPFDVTDPNAVVAAVDAATKRFGKIDILVNNAVKFDMAGILDMPIERFRRQVDIVLGGSFLMTQAVARSMVELGVRGSIINILSTAAWQGQAGNVGYCTAKSGMINFTRSVAMELARYGIRVNSLTPTATMPDEPELAERFDRAITAAAVAGVVDFARLNPWDRLPTPTDYVAPLVFLASDAAAMMTGTDVTVDGGALAKYWPQIPRRAPANGPSAPSVAALNSP